MKISRFARMSPAMKVAATLLAAAILIGTGWAGEKIYEKLTTETTEVVHVSPSKPVTLPDGSQMGVGGGMWGASVSPNDPHPMETVKRRHEEMDRLIAEKKYKATGVQEFGIGPVKHKAYGYQFTFADGTREQAGFSFPLENVSSLEELNRTSREAILKEAEKTHKAIASGKCRLIDVKVDEIHLCRNGASKQKIKVRRFVNGSSMDFAHVVPDTGNESPPEYQLTKHSSWEEHLKAIREGRRDLLGVETFITYYYETVLEDGSKFVFQGPPADEDGQPLRGPDRK